MFRLIATLLGFDRPQAAPTQPPQQPEWEPQTPVRTPRDWISNADRRSRYISEHAAALDERFSKDGGSGITLDPELNWLIIAKYPMPERWRQRWTSLMIVFPAAYPDVPPTGFYLTVQAPLKSGMHDRHLFKGSPYRHVADLSAQGWFWYCVHAQMDGSGGWQPSSDPTLPDNLFTFLNMVREALTTDD